MRDDQLINLICKGKACCAFGVNLAKITSLCKYLSSAAIQQGQIQCYPQRKSLGAPPSKICSSNEGLDYHETSTIGFYHILEPSVLFLSC